MSGARRDRTEQIGRRGTDQAQWQEHGVCAAPTPLHDVVRLHSPSTLQVREPAALGDSADATVQDGELTWCPVLLLSAPARSRSSVCALQRTFACGNFKLRNRTCSHSIEQAQLEGDMKSPEPCLLCAHARSFACLRCARPCSLCPLSVSAAESASASQRSLMPYVAVPLPHVLWRSDLREPGRARWRSCPIIYNISERVRSSRSPGSRTGSRRIMKQPNSVAAGSRRSRCRGRRDSLS